MAVGAHIDDFRYCPYHPDAKIASYAAVSSWRKPAPGMILDLLELWPVDRAGSLLIGDKASDLAAATAARLASFRFSAGRLDRFTLDCMRSDELTACTQQEELQHG